MYAFRCKTCGHFEPSGHAGEELTPHACVVCGAGVSFIKTGSKIINAENWEILADASKNRLEQLGFDGEIETHVKETNIPKSIFVETQNTLGLTQRTQ